MAEGVREFVKDRLHVKIFADRSALGGAAALAIASRIRALLGTRDFLNLVFASAPSQDETLEALCRQPGIDWTRVNAFHMDEYIGLPADAPQSFGHYIRTRFFSKLDLRKVFYIDGNAPDVHKECERYSRLLREHPTDIALLGIGENGHLAFNDPGIADFGDPLLVKVNENLDATCRQQQVNDGHFRSLADVPASAITLTIPALLGARSVFVLVPGKSKQAIVRRTLEGPVGTSCPATVLRSHADASLYLDRDSAALLSAPETR